MSGINYYTFDGLEDAQRHVELLKLSCNKRTAAQEENGSRISDMHVQ
jgi:hypothetical protein